jgi:hypothetical protein
MTTQTQSVTRRRRPSNRENFSLDESAILLGIERRHINWFVARRLIDVYRLSGFTEPRITRIELEYFAIAFGFSVNL